jgi:anti-sigma B factor antagonist
MLHRNAPLPQVAQAGEVTLATITTPELGELNVHAVAAELSRLVGGRTRPRLRLDLGQVRYLTSTALGRLVALHKRVRAAGGALALANVTDPVYEVICLTRLHEVLDVRRPDAGSSTPLAS